MFNSKKIDEKNFLTKFFEDLEKLNKENELKTSEEKIQEEKLKSIHAFMYDNVYLDIKCFSDRYNLPFFFELFKKVDISLLNLYKIGIAYKRYILKDKKKRNGLKIKKLAVNIIFKLLLIKHTQYILRYKIGFLKDMNDDDMLSLVDIVKAITGNNFSINEIKRIDPKERTCEQINFKNLYDKIEKRCSCMFKFYDGLHKEKELDENNNIKYLETKASTYAKKKYINKIHMPSFKFDYINEYNISYLKKNRKDKQFSLDELKEYYKKKVEANKIDYKLSSLESKIYSLQDIPLNLQGHIFFQNDNLNDVDLKSYNRIVNPIITKISTDLSEDISYYFENYEMKNQLEVLDKLVTTDLLEINKNKNELFFFLKGL